ncbi:MAG: hypothetical protein JSU91_05810 [Thermoplasmatales archaeon]|nr:MAG: hypothetical protein JSU91_05810 [Thermoplasmatales archaeon]
MIEKLGLKKVVWKDEQTTKVIRGNTVIDDFFVIVTPEGQGPCWIKKECVIFIKDLGDSSD